MHVKYCYRWGYFHPADCGPDNVAANHLEYFRSRNWTVDCLLINNPFKSRFAAQFHERYSWLNSVTVVDLPPTHYDFREQICAFERLTRDAAVQAILNRPADLFFTSYATTAPLLPHLPTGCRRVLETIDIMSSHYSQFERRNGSLEGIWAALAKGRDQLLLRTELELYQLFDAAIMISKEEEAFVRSRSATNAYYVPQAFVQVGQAPPRDTQEDAYDLLFVGSSFDLNVEGIKWFYQNVYVPYLWRHGVRWLIVGGVCRCIDFQDRFITLVPEVLGPLTECYAQSKVVIGPIFGGTGLPTKTVEALGMGRPAVLTPVAARGLDDDAKCYVKIDMRSQPRQTAMLLLDLLHDVNKRRALGEAARTYAERAFGWQGYVEAMDQMIQNVMRRPSRSCRRSSGPLAMQQC